MKISVFYEHIAEAVKQERRSLPDILAEVHSYGIDGIEVEDKKLYNTDIYSTIKTAGMKISGIYMFADYGNTPNPQNGFSLVNLAVSVGCKIAMIIPGLIESEGDYKPAVDNMRKAIIPIVRYAKDRGVTVVMEDFDHIKSPCTLQGLKWFLNNVEGLGIAFDTGNFWISGDNPLDAYRELKKYTFHIHCKNKLIYANTAASASPVGCGLIPMNELIESFMHDGYDGYFVIEHFGAPNQLDYIRKSAGWLMSID